MTGTADRDAAWVTIETPLGVSELEAFAGDVEQLLRINPLIEFGAFEALGPGRYRVRMRNLSNGRDDEVTLAVTRVPGGIDISYQGLLKTRTTVRIEGRDGGSRLSISDHYEGGDEASRGARLDEVDRSLTVWARALHDYLVRWRRWRWLAPWCWYMRRVWMPMKPSARRIVWLIWVISAFEVATFAIAVLVLIVARGGAQQ